VPEDSECPPAAAAIDLQLWLDLRFKNFQMLVDAPRSHAAQFAVNQRQVGENGQGKSYQHDAEHVEPVRENNGSLRPSSTAVTRRTRLDSSRQPKALAQLLLNFIHLVMVGFMIVAQQCKTPWRISTRSSLDRVRPFFFGVASCRRR